MLARLQLQDFRHAATVEFDTRLSIIFLAVRVFLRCGLLLVLVQHVVRSLVIIFASSTGELAQQFYKVGGIWRIPIQILERIGSLFLCSSWFLIL